MIKQLQQTKSEIISHIKQSFINYRNDFDSSGEWGKDSFSRLSEFISRGKLIRGILIVAGYEALGGKEKEKILCIASSIELLHAGFLMHDDVMDRDEIRRGQPAIHAAYRDLFEKHGFEDPQKNGESFAICLGNIAYFLAFDSIAASGFDPAISNRLNRILNREAVITGFGQMNDIYIASKDIVPDKKDILNTYRMKTARYTFSLPFILGAVCAGIDEKIVDQLSKIGEETGTVFQLRDDELNLFGKVEGTGKSVGSDISGGKKTLIYSMLLNNISDEERNEISQIFSEKKVSESEMEKLKTLIIESGTLNEHRELINDISLKASLMIENLETSKAHKKILNYILKLSFERKY